MEALQTVLTASEVAERLGLSTSQVRKHVQAYERVHGELGKDKASRRFYTEALAERLEAAHVAVLEGRSVSVEAALEAERDGLPLRVRQGEVRPGGLEGLGGVGAGPGGGPGGVAGCADGAHGSA